jgi:hypothetical protein
MAAKEEKRGGATEEEKRKTEIVQAEVARMKQLPPTSAYATHRLRVLDKMQQLLSKVPISTRNLFVNCGVRGNPPDNVISSFFHSCGIPQNF